MTRPTLTLALVLLAFAVVAGQPRGAYTFDADKPGGLPDGFMLGAMRQDGPGAWLVRREGADGGFLLHRADPGAAGLAFAIAPDEPLRDVVASVRLRLSGGQRTGGLVWRYLDAGNYHAAVLDLTKGELTLFRVTGGTRVFLEAEDDLELDVAAWHTMKIVHDDNEIDVLLGGIPVFRERDRRSDRAVGPGRTGVIATGNSEVAFDNLRIEPDRK